jgi:choline dehydrogenase-like flavoprotein
VRSAAESYVFRIDTSKQGRATGVTYFDRDRRERFQRARAVVACANGAETPRLLQLSANRQFRTVLRTRAGWSASSAHLLGMCRMGNDPATKMKLFGRNFEIRLASGADANCRRHAGHERQAHDRH